MINGPGQDGKKQGSAQEQSPRSAPTISLPKGGGAIRGMGEKFAANPVTGTGSMSVPIATSPGRAGFGPQLSLSYDSGAGNGPFGFGWSLSLPSITRKTDKGLPQYLDGEESDVFILSGAEDLVPVLRDDGQKYEDHTTVPGFSIRRYRPRIEGLFARIERWTNVSTGEAHWRSISKDNITTLYGKDNNARIFDPADPDPVHPTRIFTWLICESYDDKGNALVYTYKAEDNKEIDTGAAHERNRLTNTHFAQRYLKRMQYGNRTPRHANEDLRQRHDWMFEVVLDYGEHYAADTQGQPTLVDIAGEARTWPVRADAFSTCRAGFEVRTSRLCRRVLMFHHFPAEDAAGVDELAVGQNCLVRATEFRHEETRIASYLTEATHASFRRQGAGYVRRALPPLQFAYSKAEIQAELKTVDAASLENVPYGIDGAHYQFVDLYGEGVSGVLTDQAGAWFYKRNLSPLTLKTAREKNGHDIVHSDARFAPIERVGLKPALGNVGGGQQVMDLGGDGQNDLVQFAPPLAGYFPQDTDGEWQPFVSFRSQPNLDWHDPNLRHVELTGDGHADVLITQEGRLEWYRSLAKDGFEPALFVTQPLDDEQGPRLVFADGTQSVYLADMNGDGLTDLVRIGNGNVCYWPSLGYGRFGAKVTMSHAPHFDYPDQFDQKRIRLADIDGSGVADILYIGRDAIMVYLNESGNSWAKAQTITAFPRVDNLASVQAMDLLGNGTACLVWSSPLSCDARQPMRYVDLMGGQKPHLLVKAINNLGAETRVQYVPSTKFYLQDRLDGKPWITKLPFPVHVVERVETFDQISRNWFVTRYQYHHGYFDGAEREFRGFGMVEQFDTETFDTLQQDNAVRLGERADTNIDPASHVPPIHTKTWFHTGAYLEDYRISQHFIHEYCGRPKETEIDFNAKLKEFESTLLDDTILPSNLTAEEEREACRALKGSMLRQEVYALDCTDKAQHPYTVTEQNFTIRRLQPRDGNRHAVFFTHASEAINFHYEHNPADPRVQHATTLEVDAYGNVLKEAAISYGRRTTIRVVDAQGVMQEIPNEALNQLDPSDREKQTDTLVTYTENRVSNPIDNAVAHPDDYRTPLPCETRTYALTGYTPTGAAGRFQSTDFVQAAGNGLTHVFDTEIDYEDLPTNGKQRRLIEHVRMLYRPDDLGAAQNDPLALLLLGTVQPLALPGEGYKLAFTPGLLAQVFQRNGQPLLPNPANVLGGQGADRGGYLPSQQLKAEGKFPNTDPDDHWWIPAGRVLLSPNGNDTAAQELAYAQSHFFLPHRTRDPFHTNAISTESFVTYDAYDLLIVETRDALGNRVTVGERLPNGNLDPTKPGNDYRVLQPWRVMDPNRNRTQVAFDILGMVVGTAVTGKPGENLGDLLDGFVADLAEAIVLDHLNNPLADPHAILGRATTRLVYDLFAYQRTKNQPDPQPAVVYALARETHEADMEPSQQTKVQHSFSYSDGFGREIQKKIQAEPGPMVAGGPVVSSRWVGSGWTIFNNKGKSVRQYEPFFSTTPGFEFGVQVGVSPILFYDPVERVVATLHPNHTCEKVVFDPWQQTTWDVNDTVLGDPRTDADIKGFTASYFASLPVNPATPWQTWHAQRQGGALGVLEQSAASKAAAHANTPTTAHFDILGRPFLTLAHKGFNPDTTPIHFATRVELDIEGNQRAVRDAIEQAGDPQGRIVMRYAYDLLGNSIHQLSMEAGARWMLNDVSGKPIRAWDSRGHTFRTEYDPLRRPLCSFGTGADPANPNQELLTERLVYGEQHPEAELRNLRGKPYLHLDQAGSVTTEAHDFKGNPLRASRRIAIEYKQAINWGSVDAALPANATAQLDLAALEAALAPRLEADTYTSRTTYDALNRPVTLTTPHTPAMQPSVICPGYNEANLLERVDAMLRGATAAGQPVWTPFVTNIDYNAKGQRQRIDYGNGVSTFYDYNPLTFRLVHLLTRRNAVAFPDDCPQPPPADWPGCQVQNLHYTYDPVGNITHIRDDAQQTIYFVNQRVEPSAEYTYDAIYRLIDATGREHLRQIGGVPIPHSHNDAPRVGIDWTANDGNAMGAYTERYVYDAVGNFLEMQHRGSNPAHAGWMRRYAYEETSLIEDGAGGTPLKISNRLSSTTVGNNNPPVERYVYDAHGNMTRMPHLGGAHPAPNMHWDYRDQLRQTDLGGGGTAYYVYDAAGQRVRKVWEKSVNLVEERINLGGFEIYRRRQGAERLERETLHIMDDKQRIALVETRTLDTAGNDPAPERLIRYQFGNHLGSASLEMDDQAQIISYEEYTPYGSTSYQAVRSQTETPKRYRYTGKERDEETGLYYHGARYYAPWLGYWTGCDPAGVSGGVNLYSYVSQNPMRFHDPAGRNAEEFMRQGETYIAQVTELKNELSNVTHLIAEDSGKYDAALRRYNASGKTDIAALDSMQDAARKLVRYQSSVRDLQQRALQLNTNPITSTIKYPWAGKVGTHGDVLEELLTLELKLSETAVTSSSPRTVDALKQTLNDVRTAQNTLGQVIEEAPKVQQVVTGAARNAGNLVRIGVASLAAAAGIVLGGLQVYNGVTGALEADDPEDVVVPGLQIGAGGASVLGGIGAFLGIRSLALLGPPGLVLGAGIAGLEVGSAAAPFVYGDIYKRVPGFHKNQPERLYLQPGETPEPEPIEGGHPGTTYSDEELERLEFVH